MLLNWKIEESISQVLGSILLETLKMHCSIINYSHHAIQRHQILREQRMDTKKSWDIFEGQGCEGRQGIYFFLNLWSWKTKGKDKKENGKYELISNAANIWFPFIFCLPIKQNSVFLWFCNWNHFNRRVNFGAALWHDYAVKLQNICSLSDLNSFMALKWQITSQESGLRTNEIILAWHIYF